MPDDKKMKAASSLRLSTILSAGYTGSENSYYSHIFRNYSARFLLKPKGFLCDCRRLGALSAQEGKPVAFGGILKEMIEVGEDSAGADGLPSVSS